MSTCSDTIPYHSTAMMSSCLASFSSFYTSSAYTTPGTMVNDPVIMSFDSHKGHFIGACRDFALSPNSSIYLLLKLSCLHFMISVYFAYCLEITFYPASNSLILICYMLGNIETTLHRIICQGHWGLNESLVVGLNYNGWVLQSLGRPHRKTDGESPETPANCLLLFIEFIWVGFYFISFKCTNSQLSWKSKKAFILYMLMLTDGRKVIIAY